MRGLGAQGALVQEVAEYAEGEDCYGETVAAVPCVPSSEFREDLVVVFWRSSGEFFMKLLCGLVMWVPCRAMVLEEKSFSRL